MKITTVELRNFQRHKKLVLELDPGITIIRGATDKGKSAIIRALQWAVLNNIPGDSFVRLSSKGAGVALKLNDGLFLERRRGNKGNRYLLNGKRFVAFGSSVPAEIKTAVPFSELNFQNQHDSPFWIGLKPGDMAKELNEIVDLSVIDTTLKRSQLLKRQAVSALQMYETELEETKEQLEQMGNVQARIQSFSAIQDQHSILQKTKKTYTALKAIVGTVEDLQSRIRKIPNADKLKEAYHNWKAAKQKWNKLKSLLYSIAFHQEQADTWKLKTKKRKIDLAKRTNGQACPLCKRPMKLPL